MPQLDPSTFASQLFWLFATFVPLMIGIHVWVAPNLKRILKKRWDRIEGTLDRAERLTQEAQALRAEAEAALLAAHKDSLQMIRAAQEEIAQDISQKQHAFAAETAERIQEAQDKIQFAKQKALKEAEKVVLETTNAMLMKLLGQEVDTGQVESEIRRVMGNPSP